MAGHSFKLSHSLELQLAIWDGWVIRLLIPWHLWVMIISLRTKVMYFVHKCLMLRTVFVSFFITNYSRIPTNLHKEQLGDPMWIIIFCGLFCLCWSFLLILKGTELLSFQPRITHRTPFHPSTRKKQQPACLGRQVVTQVARTQAILGIIIQFQDLELHITWEPIEK